MVANKHQRSQAYYLDYAIANYLNTETEKPNIFLLDGTPRKSLQIAKPQDQYWLVKRK